MSERDDSDDKEPVPKLPRGRGFRLTGPEMFRIVITGAMLVAILVLAKPCGNAVSNFVMGMDGSGSRSAMPKPGKVDVPQLPGSAGDYVELHPGMTDEEVRQAIEQAKAKQRARDGAANGSAMGPATTGSAATAVPSAPGSAASSGR